MRRSLYSVGAGVVMSLALAAPAAAAPVQPFTETTACDSGRVCMWEDPFKAGNRYVHSTQTTFEIPGWDGDNEISSVWNRTGQKLTIFDNDGYTGTRICLNAGEYVAELGPERAFDNEAESYKLANNCL
ncbi:peptidase inhibitor family I36 protein [Micromonospora sp. CPCC 205546]|nr:peptidase inhibitor family I36 protein [Micromonospora echinofusca]